MISVRLRPLAEQDLVDQTRHYAAQAGPELTERFFDTAAETLNPDANEFSTPLDRGLTVSSTSCSAY